MTGASLMRSAQAVATDVETILALEPNGIYSRVVFVSREVYGDCDSIEPDELTLAIHAFRGVGGEWFLQLHEVMLLDGWGMTTHQEGKTLVRVNDPARIPQEVEALIALATLHAKDLREQYEKDLAADAREEARKCMV